MKIARRHFFRVATGLMVVPLAQVLGQTAGHASGVEKVDPESDQARQLGYRHDASEVDINAFPKRAGTNNQFCKTCQFFGGTAEDEWAKCVIFSGNLVNGSGWCSSWFERAW